MGDVGDYWREARDYRRNVQPWQYQCECGVRVPKRKKACSACGRANPHVVKRKKKEARSDAG